jgi:mono/diheme cytochrome c family protein
MKGIKLRNTTILAGTVAVGAFAIALWLGGVFGDPAGLPYDQPGAVARGRVLYADNCATCHGPKLEGDVDWQSPLETGRMPAPPHDQFGHTWHHGEDLLIDITTRGSAEVIGDGYESDMPGFGGTLSPAEINEVLGYIKSTWPKEMIEWNNELTDQAAR